MSTMSHCKVHTAPMTKMNVNLFVSTLSGMFFIIISFGSLRIHVAARGPRTWSSHPPFYEIDSKVLNAA